MRLNIFGNVHGKHCLLRAFKSVCHKCKNDVFYWECSHGSKVFFEYPIYGRLIRHKCKKHLNNQKIKNKYQIQVKIPLFLEKDVFGYSICSKIFNKKNQLTDHIKQLKKSDLDHSFFYNNKTNFETEKEIADSDFNKSLSENKNRSHNKPIFGKITIINKKSSNN